MSNTVTLTQVSKSPKPLKSNISGQRTDIFNNKNQYIQFISAEDKLSESFELIKIIKQHQHSNRWILMIAPQNIPDKALLDCCSVEMNHVLVIREKQITSILATIENALLHSTCSAIIAWSGHWQNQLSQRKLEHIQLMARRSECQFYGFTQQFNSNEQELEADLTQHH